MWRPRDVYRLRRGTQTRARLLRLGLACSLVPTLWALPLRADHEAPFYPSFYPQEIRIETLDPATAVAEWSKPRVHAYVGADLFAGGSVPADAGSVTSLSSYLVLSFDATSGRYAAGSVEAGSRCAAAERLLPLLSQNRTDYIFHPYPVTPYHPDYLEHFDLAQRQRQRFAVQPVDTGPALRIRAVGKLAEALLPPGSRAGAQAWDATLEEVDIESLIGREVPQPWIKQGWFQAHLLYANEATGAMRLEEGRTYRRVMLGEYRSDTERINLERQLVTALISACERVVVGYTLRHEYFNAEYSNGVEDVAFDSQAGLSSAIFPRSVKLKDFPWNGWLRIGVAARPSAAWNPIAGFSDSFSRLLWLSVADPALLLHPYGGSWIANRASIDRDARDTSPVRVPATTLKPELGSGRLRAVGTGKLAQQRIRYSVVTSAFHDGTATGVADLLYPYIFAFRWGDRRDANGPRDPLVSRSTALTREWLAGIAVLRVDTQTRNFGGDLKFSYRVPVIDVYLNHRASDRWLAAAVAPPWSGLPWELIVLMEEAVTRGIAGFSREEAERRGIPWLDLVRSPELGVRLAALVEQFRREGYRPEALKKLVTVAEARERWSALARFHDEHHHFLVTNGPYRLESWSDDAVVLQVFRDTSYPLGVGAFDAYAIPIKAYVAKVDDQRDRIEISGEVEEVMIAQRSYQIERVAVTPPRPEEHNDERPECRYVIVGPAGSVVRSGTATIGTNGRFAISVKQLGPAGTYTIAAALLVGGNQVNPEVKVFEHRVARSSPNVESGPRAVSSTAVH
jgi:hypothetical protein